MTPSPEDEVFRIYQEHLNYTRVADPSGDFRTAAALLTVATMVEKIRRDMSRPRRPNCPL